jgi:hypothetical protein
MLGIFEAWVTVTSPDRDKPRRWMRYAYSREAIRKCGDDLIKANKDTINTVSIEYKEK